MKLVLEKDKIKQEAPERIIPFKELTFKQKLIHIWEYYKWHIIIPVAAVISAVSIGLAVYENCKDSVLYAVFINTQMTDTTAETFMDEFVDYAGLDMKGKKITLDTTLYINQKNSDINSVSSSQKLLAMFTSIEMDVIICNQDNFDYYAAQDSFVELSEVLPADFLSQHEDLLMSAVGKDGKEHIFGISVKDSPKLAEYHAFLEDPVLTVPVTRMEEENIKLFLSFLLGE